MNARPSLLVTGASGLLGGRVATMAAIAGWDVTGTYLDHPPSLPAVAAARMALPLDAPALIRELRPAAVVHTAYTRAAAQLWPVVVHGSAAVAAASAAVGARLIHLSSDAVFGGRAAPYREDDDPTPVSPYGAAKAAAEAVVAALHPAALLVRTSLLYTPPGALPADPFLALARRFARDPQAGALFADELRCPICVDDLAAALLELLPGRLSGLLHIAGPTLISRYEFGRLQLLAAGDDPAGLVAGSAAGAATRPGRVELDSSRARSWLRTPLRSPLAVLCGED